ncbi:OPT-domain-containing protein [Tilletiaria anomala UBC 951]|uniref:OPT-domain-containing protein n=1 Tax=Tilletiaria anomala (strain ATCC 24038 / CBS 436.72 / UBC 951) TaxID=1037660 RepID=A0A066V4D1_TILAU|nr:OPT-domain-containing protein [Tilletiaria anomala UBC 951]KDN36291.1 OPT-domain-containing protein [Tilletiaria anomala UBC 951]
MASSGTNDLQPLGTADMAADRISRELQRQASLSGSASGSFGDNKKHLSDEVAAVSGVDSIPYETEKRSRSDGLIEEEDFEPYDVASGQPFAESEMPVEIGTGLTFRSLLVGTLLGLIIAASNVYLGLKTGFTFGASLFGSLIGCAILKAISRNDSFDHQKDGFIRSRIIKAISRNDSLDRQQDGSFRSRILKVISRNNKAINRNNSADRQKGGFFSFREPFGPKENVTVQSAATASGSLTGMFVAAIPAAAQLGLLNDPITDFGRLITFSLCSAYYGVFFAIPLRKFYILRQRLVFPSATATALTIRALHAPGGDAAMKKKTRCLLFAFVAAFILVVVQQYVPGILQDWHIFYWIYAWGGKSAIIVDSWGWIIELTPAFFGAGVLSGMNASWSFLFGALLSWGLIGPLTIHSGVTVGRQSEIEPLAYSFTSMRTTSPRYFLMWPGVAMMLFYSFAELAITGPAIYRSIKSLTVNVYRAARKLDKQENEDEFDPAPKSQQVQSWSWPSGWLLSCVVTILVCTLQFHMNGGNVILSILLAWIFAFIGVACESLVQIPRVTSGTTDINPLGTIAKMSQLVVGGALKAEGRTGPPAQLENLLAGSIASSAASHAVDMLGDLKTGHLIRASPRTQYYAQLIGSLFAVPFSVGMYVLFAKAYPCVINGPLFDEGKCQFSAPSVAAWRSVTVAVTTPNAIPFVSGMVAIGLGIFSAIVPFIKHFLVPQKYKVWVPNFNAVGLAFVLPQVYYPIAMAVGATFSFLWQRKNLRNWDTYAYVLAAGLVCGEGLGGVFNAVLQIAGVSGSDYGVTVGDLEVDGQPWLVASRPWDSAGGYAYVGRYDDSYSSLLSEVQASPSAYPNQALSHGAIIWDNGGAGAYTYHLYDPADPSGQLSPLKELSQFNFGAAPVMPKLVQCPHTDADSYHQRAAYQGGQIIAWYQVGQLVDHYMCPSDLMGKRNLLAPEQTFARLYLDAPFASIPVAHVDAPGTEAVPASRDSSQPQDSPTRPCHIRTARNTVAHLQALDWTRRMHMEDFAPKSRHRPHRHRSWRWRPCGCKFTHECIRLWSRPELVHITSLVQQHPDILEMLRASSAPPPEYQLGYNTGVASRQGQVGRPETPKMVHGSAWINALGGKQRQDAGLAAADWNGATQQGQAYRADAAPGTATAALDQQPYGAAAESYAANGEQMGQGKLQR